MLTNPTPILNSSFDALAITVHSTVLNSGFQCICLDENDMHRSETLVENNEHSLPVEWNAQGPNYYSFCYRSASNSLIVKCIKLGEHFIVHTLVNESKHLFSLEVSATDYASASQFPYEGQGQPLEQCFVSSEKFSGFVSLLTSRLFSSADPVELTRRAAPASSSSAQQHTNAPVTLPMHESPRTFPSVGRSDLEPLGGLQPPSGGGMHVGPDHPIFDMGGNDPTRPDIFGAPPQLPPGSVPPGARFDPVTPFGPFPPHHRGPGRGSRGRGSAPFPGEPDNDEMPPPGFDNDMFM